MTRKCSHCSHNGHNSRICPNRGVKIFGVRLTDGSIRKSASMSNLSHYTGSNSGLLGNNYNNPGSPGSTPDHGPGEDGYASEDLVPGSSSASRDRKKGVPWTEEEHRMFLLGLQKLGKGDWRGISPNFLISRTLTQVASHAQKYFTRQTNISKRKRRTSLFDIVADELCYVTLLHTPMMSPDIFPTNDSEAKLSQSNDPSPLPPTLDDECESMDSTNSNNGEPEHDSPNPEEISYPVVFSTYISPFFPFSIPLWPGYNPEETKKQRHEVIKSTAIHSKNHINVDELVGMSTLSLGESSSSSLSLILCNGSTRKSAFHANPAAESSGVKANTNPIHAV